MSEPAPPTPEEDPVIRWIDQWVLPYFQDTSLWPVLFAVVCSALCLLAVLLVSTWRTHAAWAWAGVTLLVLLTFDVIRREVAVRRRPGRISVAVVLAWSVAGAVAALASRYGIL